MFTLNNVFYEIALILIIATAMGALAVWLRQPLIMAFIGVGILVGPAGLEIVKSSTEVELFAEMGIALLLFVVGLKLNPQEIRETGAVAIIAGLGQIGLTALLGDFLALNLGFTGVEAFYIGIALTFSSTIIIVKLLSDQREIDALHGRISVGILIIQDLVVILVMITLSTLMGNQAQGGLIQAIILVFWKGGGFILAVALITRFILPFLLDNLARSTELLLVFAISWAIALASVGDALGFSKEVGAFIAGVSLASTHYRITIGSKLMSIRDFLLLFFFINLGIHIDVSHFGAAFLPALILSTFTFIGKPLMVMVLVEMMGYRKYTSAMTSLSQSQISEFSLILANLGLSLGQISEEVLGLITLVGLITMGCSTYMIIYGHRIYEWLSPVLTELEKFIPHPKKTLADLSETEVDRVDIILFGLGRYGGSMIANLQHLGIKVLGVDFDPEIVRFWKKKGVLAFYGDAEDPEFTATLPLREAKWIVSTLPGERIGLVLLHTLQHHHFQGKIALTSHNLKEMKTLQKAGADLVLLPFRDAATQASRTLAQLT
ncbi:sodium/hydrogen exchanger [Gloeothece citriformis PCC 7424]|uniref:Sodium/hydrogen exchanger n=1 Tax=Gloeothece citriformis (strain PCC 7424) TaxID=65393 RepID=B7KBJ6_GLOC7|nr:cation:proton antiporter family protein [Gloeothece citriformis]ACK72974.1 sodium/hydrogen exchanger [Gloeothece citriformis PCC 7424]